MTIGEKIMYARKHKGWSQSDLAGEIGKLSMDRGSEKISKGTISLWESGKSNPSPKNTKKLSLVLGLPMELFIGEMTDDINSEIEKAKKIPPEKIREKLQGLGLSDEKIEAAIRLLL